MSLFELQREGDVQELIRVLRESDNDDVRQRAASILGEFEDHQDRRDIVSALVRAAREDDAGAVTAAAVDSLDDLGGDAIESLIEDMAGVDFDAEGADWVRAKAFVNALEADVPELRMAAANGLGQFGDSDAIEPLVARFGDDDPRVRARAARSCGSIGDPRAVSQLEGLLTDPTVVVRREAAQALGQIGNRQALSALLDMYDDPSERVRRIAVGAFGNFENAAPVDALVEALADESATVRRTAVYSLIELLANVPTEKSHEIRETIVDRLSETDDESVVVPLVEIIEEGTQAAQRRNTAWLLGRVVTDADERVIDALVEALADDDQMTAQFAATSLAQLEDDRVEDRLLEVVTDADRPTNARTQAIFTLGKVGGERSRETLDALLDETDDEEIRKRAFSAISKLGGRL
ncbi:HEAT repeat domain-containing protein [Halorhabdus amylolytica]|uniref:HEAT repeat domain-containing protein n=1 Tax=Halorhabdus amylolytica TaxID=2559573 RepID=UPI0010AAA895|nr:HEAT repeat domain-containing protein [Halorhabdus amylolytica]